jgi:hypothetical protein
MLLDANVKGPFNILQKVLKTWFLHSFKMIIVVIIVLFMHQPRNVKQLKR